MDASVLLVFVPACLAINLTPGPNNLLSISNAARYGFRRAALAGSGRLVAFAAMIALASAGLAVVLQTSELLFQAIKLAGALYLLHLALQLWRAPAGAPSQESAAAPGLLGLMRQEFLVAAGNPKAILVFTAFLPQFVDPSAPAAAQFALLGTIFLAFEWFAIAVYSASGAQLKRWLAQDRGRRLFNRGCALLLGGAGVGLVAMRRGADAA
jgi:threonine/homoserine/homoserine lactone efflux protein